MKLQTHIPLNKAEKPIDYDSSILLLGSCFSNNIGQKFGYFQFRSAHNPFGILFHPKAIENLIAKSIAQKEYSEDDIFFLNEQWHCYDVHSDLSDASKDRLVQKLNKGLTGAYQQIKESTHVIVTLGTSWVYRRTDAGRIVANCHKVPQKEFEKLLLSIDDISKSLRNIIDSIRVVNQKALIIFTVSPVRHLKDGFTENQLSKSRLISAIHDILGVPPLGVKGLSPSFGGGRGEAYFPSYEIMMDELRDYRFYESDMVHPNQVAIDYIWERFRQSWISEKAYPVMEQVDAVQKGLAHRPFNADSLRHKEFRKSLEGKITYLKERYPHMIFYQ
ncbi:GSCFA domain-containing protein [Maribacter algicola]|uniref:GSCFA domain-containing protein n=1 Tax=Meishania litoralis TaxID=3434685 RepID=A0ACC7LIQ0_9FLAO